MEENAETMELAVRLAQADETIEFLVAELAQEKECYSAYYLDLFLKSDKSSYDNAVLLKSALVEKSKLMEQNASLWKIIFSLLKSSRNK
jgi:hypothetical protein